jgi:hypothetical protein
VANYTSISEKLDPEEVHQLTGRTERSSPFTEYLQ